MNSHCAFPLLPENPTAISSLRPGLPLRGFHFDFPFPFVFPYKIDSHFRFHVIAIHIPIPVSIPICRVTVKFPRRSTNRFAKVEGEVATLEEVREARIFFALNTLDMDGEMERIMSDGLLPSLLPTSVTNSMYAKQQLDMKLIYCTRQL